MIPNEYHKLVAQQILSCDIERLDAAIREATGHGLYTLIKPLKPKCSNIDFKTFTLQRYAYKDIWKYIGKEPQTATHPAMVWEIKCERMPLDTAKATAFLNGRILFDLNTFSMHRAAKMTISALRRYKQDNVRRNRRTHAKKKGGEA